MKTKNVIPLVVFIMFFVLLVTINRASAQSAFKATEIGVAKIKKALE